MTHYMELLTTNQPWNLLIFMAVPVIVAETLAISELYLLFTKKTTGRIRKLSRIAGTFGGIYFTGIFIYLFINAVIPVTNNNAWRGFADIIAVGSYLAGVVPLATITLLNLGVIFRDASTHKKQIVHSVSIGVFLVIAHVAMIFGMINPTVTGWQDTAAVSTASTMSMDEMNATLAKSTGEDFDKAFLSEMIIHHQGAIEMAQKASSDASHQEVREMASAIIQAQSEEIAQMQAWQVEWGYASSSSMMNGHSMEGM